MTRNVQHELTAFIYDKRGRLLSMGKNSYIKTHPLQKKCADFVGARYPDERCFMHAEIQAIVRCKDISKAHRILVTRFTPGGKAALAKPCKMCQHAISMTPIKVIDHT